jgi:Protein of unknown function (DUF3443)
MRAVSRTLVAGLIVAAMTACGGGGGASSSTTTPPPPPPPAAAANVVAVTVSPGPAGSGENADINTLFTSVKVCVPGSTTECQTIDNVQVDTGSYGLRLIASVVTLTLPVETLTGGNTLVECTEFADGYSWGSVALADMTLGGETAASVPIQLIGSTGIAAAPSTCAGTGTAENTVAQFGANGLLGVGVFAQDCGPSCVASGSTSDAYSSYYSCSATACAPSGTVTLTAQVTNPVTLFAAGTSGVADNNGVIIVLPSIASAGAASATGSMIFGIDTETNNKSGNQSIVALNPDVGEFTTSFNSQSLPDSVFDTGSNAYYFSDSGITQCTTFTGFYCPSSILSLSASVQGQNEAGTAEGTAVSVPFSVASAEALSSSEPTFIVFSNLAGVLPSTGNSQLTGSFDWGLPFYFGRTVFTAYEGYTTSVGTGPYVAF